MIVSGGYDEISRLSVNVENMRKSILYNLEKEREARDANTELITAMSHDVRTPLTVLLGYLEMMRAEAEEGGVMQEYIDASERTAMRLKQLSDDMFKNSLAFGNTEEGIDLEEYDAKMLLEQLLSEHILLMRENGYKLTYETVGEELCEGDVILTDAPNLMRIIDNVFSNIYKYADLAEEVRMSLETEGDILRFTCSNTPLCDTSKAESNGIGLKTCKRLARFVANDFSYGMVGDKFVTVLSLNIKRHGENTERTVNR
jgi:signal transduction histidine kinase